MRRFAGRSALSAVSAVASRSGPSRRFPFSLLLAGRVMSCGSTATSTPSAAENAHPHPRHREDENEPARPSPSPSPSSSRPPSKAAAPATTVAVRRSAGTNATRSGGAASQSSRTRRRRGDRKTAASATRKSTKGHALAKEHAGNDKAAPSTSPRHTPQQSELCSLPATASLRRRGVGESRARHTAAQAKETALLQALATVDDVARGRHAAAAPAPSAAHSKVKDHAGASAGAVDPAAVAPTQPEAAAHASLLAHLTACDFVAKLQGTLRRVAVAPLAGRWRRGPSDGTLRHMERQLELLIQQGSFEAYAALGESMRRRCKDPLSSVGVAKAASSRVRGVAGALRCDNERLLLLYARLLVNYGTFCLLNSEPQKAVSLLREALHTVSAADAAARGQRGSRQPGTPAEAGDTALPAASPSLYADTAVLYIRLLLANALSCERLHWQAAEQYAEVLRVMEEHPLDASAGEGETAGDALAQLSPGATAFMPLFRPLAHEDARLFFSDTARLRKALSQGQAHELLLQSQGAAPAVLAQLRLTMARVYRLGSTHARRSRKSAATQQLQRLTATTMLHQSRELYEAYLDDLVSREEEDTQHAMLELGRMLCADPATAAGEGVSLNDTEAVTKELEAGLIYLEAASEVLLEEAELALAGENLTVRQRQLVVRTAGVLVDAAEAHVRNENEAAALGLLEGCLSLLGRAGLSGIGAWVLQRYADTLSSVSFVDRAIVKYTAAMDILRASERFATQDDADEDVGLAELDDEGVPLSSSSRSSAGTLRGGAPPLQLGPSGKFVSLTSADVEASLAYCYQIYVGDPRRAVWHYERVLDSLLSAGQQSSGKRTTQQPLSAGRRRRMPPVRSSGAVIASLMPMEREHFVLTNMVACCERVQDWDNAIAAQNRLIALEAVQGNYAIAACLRSVALMEMKGDYATMLGVLFYLLLLPAEEMEPSVRLTVTHYFVKCCYALGNQTMGSILLNAVRQMEGDHNVAVVLDWAVNAEKLDASEKLTVYDAVDMKADVKTIADTFLRAAQLLIAHRVSDEADRVHAAEAAEDQTVSAGIFAAAPKKLPLMSLDMERDSLITLSRGAFFFHQNGYSKQAEELYEAAVGFAAEVDVSPSFTTTAAAAAGLPRDAAERFHEYQRELAILLANFATLKLSTDPARAEQLYTRAAAIRPAPLEVAEVVAHYFVQSGNYVQGAAHMSRVMEAHPESAVEMHGRVARLGCGQPWPLLTAAQRLDVHEHLVLGLGVRADLVPRYPSDSPTTDANMGERLAALDALTLTGVSTTASDEAACLACFLIQTKYPSKPRLINRLYTQALRRFPFHTAILVNYAKFCCDYERHALARKLYARAYGAADGDFCRTLCYVNYLSHAFGVEQAAAGEALYRAHLRHEPQSSQAHMHYANYLAVMMSAPAVAETHFEKGVELDPQSKHMGLYAQFVWACADNPAVSQDRDIRTQLFDRAEALFKRAVEIEPDNPVALQSLGTFFANRRNRFEEAVQTLYKAHKLSPANVEVMRQLGSVLLEECVRLQSEEHERNRAAAKQSLSASSSMSSRLRSLTESTEQVFEKSIALDPTHRETLEKYAAFAVTVMKNPSLAADLWKRIQHLDRK